VTEAAEVVIAGGGPTGLMLAIELCLGGIVPVVLEREPEISQVPKGNGLVGQIVTVLAYRGLLERLREGASYAGPVPGFSFGPLRLDFTRLGDSPLQVLAIPQRRLEQRLEDRLRELGGGVRRGHELTGLAGDDGGVTISVTSPAGGYQLRAGYLVGCDGAHSLVRKQAGIEFPGYTSSAVTRIGRVTLPTAVIAAGGAAIEVPGIGRLRLTEQVSTRAGGSYSLAWSRSLDTQAPPGAFIVSTREERAGDGEPQRSGAAELTEQPMTLEELGASIRRVVGGDLPMTDPSWLTRIVGNSRQADRYQAGRVLLAGDAAHIFGVGGSLNIGLTDAINLGWKLAAVAAGRARAELLASYHAERHAAGRRALLQTRAQQALGRSGEAAEALRELVGELLEYPGAARHVGEMIAGADVRYDVSATGAPPHPLLGRLAPDLRVRAREAGPDADADADADQLTSVAGLLRATAWPVLLDLTTDGRVAAAAGVARGHVSIMVAEPLAEPAVADALLIRPDGYVACLVRGQLAGRRRTSRAALH